MKYDVICVGTSTIDLFVTPYEKLTKIQKGDKVLVEDLDYETGGGGSNSSVALSRLGCKVAYLGKVGDDHNGEKVLKELKKEKVSVIKTNLSKLRTSFSVVMLSKKEKGRIIYVYKGASNDLSINDFKLSQLNAKWFYIGSVMDKTLNTVEKIISSSKFKSKILFNPSAYLLKDRRKINKILQKTDILVLNKKEAQILTEKKESPDKIYKEIISLGPKELIITDGSRGVYYFTEKSKLKIPSPKVKVISTAGAGDAFISGFLAGRIKNKSAKQSLIIGNKNAGSVLKHLGAKNNLLTWKEVNK